MSAAQFLIDTSALARFLRGDAERHGWDQAAAAGLIATCPVTELEFFYSARSAADRTQGIKDLRLLFGWVPVADRAFDRAWQVQEALTERGQRRTRRSHGGRRSGTPGPDLAAQGPRLRAHRGRYRPGPPVVRSGGR